MCVIASAFSSRSASSSSFPTRLSMCLKASVSLRSWLFTLTAMWGSSRLGLTQTLSLTLPYFGKTSKPFGDFPQPLGQGHYYLCRVYELLLDYLRLADHVRGGDCPGPYGLVPLIYVCSRHHVAAVIVGCGVARVPIAGVASWRSFAQLDYVHSPADFVRSLHSPGAGDSRYRGQDQKHDYERKTAAAAAMSVPPKKTTVFGSRLRALRAVPDMTRGGRGAGGVGCLKGMGLPSRSTFRRAYDGLTRSPGRCRSDRCDAGLLAENLPSSACLAAAGTAGSIRIALLSKALAASSNILESYL